MFNMHWSKTLRASRCFLILFIVWVIIFVVFCFYTFNTPFGAKLGRPEVPYEDVIFNKFGNWKDEAYSHSGKYTRHKRVVLIVQKYTKTNVPKAINHMIRYLESFRINYVITRTDDRLLVDLKYELTKDVEKPKYSLIIFYEFQTFLSLSPFARDVINNYCAKFETGQIFFAGNNYGTVSRFNFEVKRVEKDKRFNLHVNERSSILWVTKPGVVVGRSSRVRLSYMNVLSADHHYETIAYLAPSGQGNVDEMGKAVMLLDKGGSGGIRRLFTTLSSAFFLNELLFLDALKFFSVLPPEYSLHRYIQVDIDDIFIGKTGLRLKKADVTDLLQTQRILQKRIPGFQFQIGFSGKGFKRGDDVEDEGDDALIDQRSAFSWFCHMWDHEQAHKFDNKTVLVNLMEKNKRFAKKHGIIINSSYAVASHHSGVYPVQESLFAAWKQVYGITVTTTEEYPSLKPAWLRKGFQHNGIKVLPRQTCNVYTSTNFFKEIPGGKPALDQSVEGGEIFETVLRNPVSIFMTHMTNYANDRIAPYLFKKLVKFVQKWTRIKLLSAPPPKLAEIYFKMFPEDRTPIWQNPCDHNRHLAIWPIDKSCSRLPSVLVIGPAHGGVGILGDLLQLHPRMKSPGQVGNVPVETNFFSTDNYLRGLDWYMDFFPRNTEIYEKIFEVSSTYFESAKAAYRASLLLKIAKIVIVLPDPVQRSYIHYMHLRENRLLKIAERYSFDDLIMNPGKNSEVLKLRELLLTSGHYAECLMRWMTYYSAQQVLIISDDDLVFRATKVLKHIQDFMNMEKAVNYNQLIRYDTSNSIYCPLKSNTVEDCYGYKERRCAEMSSKVRSYLKEYYQTHNKNLLRLNQKVQFTIPKWLKEYG